MTSQPLTLVPFPSAFPVVQGQWFSYQFQAQGGTPPYSFQRLSGTIPLALTLTPAGMLSGTVQAFPPDFTFVIGVQDAAGGLATAAVDFPISSPTLVASDVALHTSTGGQVSTINVREYMGVDAAGRHYLLYQDGATATWGLRSWLPDWSAVADIADIGIGNVAQGVASFSCDGTTLRVMMGTAGGRGVSVYDVALAGSPLPSAASFLHRTDLDPSDTYVPLHMIRLASGADVVAAYVAGAYDPTLPIEHGSGGYPINPVLWYRPAGAVGGAFGAPIPFVWLEYGPTPFAQATLCQHPTDGGVWIFEAGDDNQAINATRFAEAGGGLVKTKDIVHWVPPDFPPSGSPAHAGGPQAMYCMVPDPANGVIVCAWGDNAYGPGAFPNVPNPENAIREGVTVARMAADGTYTVLPSLLDNASPFGAHMGLALDASGSAWPFYAVVDLASASPTQQPTTHNVHAARWTGTAWVPFASGTVYPGARIVGAQRGGAIAIAQADAPDYQAHQFSFTPGQAVVAVTVSDKVSGAPIASAVVTVGPTQSATDAAGRASFTVMAGTYNVAVSAVGYAPFSVSVTVNTGQTVQVAAQLTANTGVVVVTVTDKVTGQPVPGATVQVGTASAQTNAAGQASFTVAT